MHLIRKAFTLIELLVVITIIVVLLALLTPALDRAIYEAQMVVCATTLKSIGTGVTVYASANRRRYPHRESVRDQANETPRIIRLGDETAEYERLLPYITVDKAFNDPFLEPVVFTIAEPDVTLEAAQFLWYGWEWRHNGTHKGMFKLGDRFSYTDANNKTWKWSLLATDQDFRADDLDVTHDTHPDRDGVLQEEHCQNCDSFFAFKAVHARWVGEQGARGEVDHNYALADGSVYRIEDIKDDEWDPSVYTIPRLVKLPTSAEGFNWDAWYVLLPQPNAR